MQANRKVLIIGPAWVGDMVMAQTLFTSIKKNEPNTQIDVVAPSWSGPLLARMPEIDDFYTLKVPHNKLQLSVRYQLAKQLRSKNYDQAILLPNSFKSALLPLWAKIPIRTGWRGEFRYGLVNDMRILDKSLYPLMIERFMALAYPKGAPLPRPYPNPKLIADKISQQKSVEKFNLKIDKKPILALCPGAEFGPAKRWPVDYYAEVAAMALAANWQVWLFGSKNDMPLAAKIQQFANNQCDDLVGETSLAQAIDLLAMVNAVVTNDSGLMHIAAALQRPQVVVYGSTSPKFTPPLADNIKLIQRDLDCQPCFERTCPLEHMRCLTDIQPKEVYNAVLELI
ncbi:MAG: lipopolysaccharide heptosyltransferase II [Pseudomonadota bacterium]